MAYMVDPYGKQKVAAPPRPTYRPPRRPAYTPPTAVRTTPRSTAPAGSTQQDAMRLAADNTTGVMGGSGYERDNREKYGTSGEGYSDDSVTPYKSSYVRPDYTNEINSQYDNLANSMKAKLRANLQNALARFGGMKNVAKQQALGSLNANDATMLQNLQRLYNSNEAGGQYGDTGENMTGKIQLGAMQGENANAIRQDRDNYLNELDTEANALQSTADDQEAAILSEIESSRMRDLMEMNKWADSMDAQNEEFQYGISKDTQDRLDKMAEMKTRDEQWQQSFDADQKWRDYEAKQAERETQWARSENNPAVKAQILANQISELELMNLPEQQKLEIQRLRKQIAQIGAVQPISDYERQMQDVALQTAREKLNQMKNPATTVSASDYKTNPDFADEMAGIYQNPATALSKIQANASALIKKYGVDGYNELVAAATPKGTGWQSYVGN